MLWALCAIAASVGMTVQSYRAGGEAGQLKWPAEATHPLSAHRPTLVMFVHPDCSCSGASLEELSRLMVTRRGEVALQIWFYQPIAGYESWLESPLRKVAQALPDAAVLTDFDGREAHRFGAETSGYVALYAPDGTRLFGGGITLARGHRGTSVGERAIARWVRGEPDLSVAPVFGCKIQESVERSLEKENQAL